MKQTQNPQGTNQKKGKEKKKKKKNREKEREQKEDVVLGLQGCT
jgi:hypothetical protein